MGLEAYAILGGLVAIGGLIGVLWLAAYLEGRNAAQKASAEASLKKQQTVDDAVAQLRGEHAGSDFYLGADGRVYRRPAPPASVPRGTKPDTQ